MLNERSAAEAQTDLQFNQELEELVRRTRELEEANQQLRRKTRMLEKLALTDALTRLPNRRAMDQCARAELARYRRYHGALALAVIDIDYFKEVNRIHLVTGGDHVLCAVAKTLRRSVRAVDTVGRIGGEEFLVVAPQADQEGAAVLGERVRCAVETGRFSFRGERIAVTVSIGIAVAASRAAAEYHPMKHLAAACLGEAKARGRNCCVIRVVESALREVSGTECGRQSGGGIISGTSGGM